MAPADIPDSGPWPASACRHGHDGKLLALSLVTMARRAMPYVEKQVVVEFSNACWALPKAPPFRCANNQEGGNAD